MTDDLVKRLRDKWKHNEDDCYAAADRIEELEAVLLAVFEMLSKRLPAEEMCEMAYEYLLEMYQNDR